MVNIQVALLSCHLLVPKLNKDVDELILCFGVDHCNMSLHLVPYHLYGVKVWALRWPHVLPVDVIVPHKVFGHLRPMFWIIVLLEPVTIWKLYLDVCQEVISEDAVSEEFLLHDVLKYC